MSGLVRLTRCVSGVQQQQQLAGAGAGAARARQLSTGQGQRQDEIKRVTVIGGGLMGSGIAQVRVCSVIS